MREKRIKYTKTIRNRGKISKKKLKKNNEKTAKEEEEEQNRRRSIKKIVTSQKSKDTYQNDDERRIEKMYSVGEHHTMAWFYSMKCVQNSHTHTNTHIVNRLRNVWHRR